MHNIPDIGLTFLILTKGWWGTDQDIRTLKRRAVAKAKWKKGEERIYFLFLVHEDTMYNMEEQRFEFPSKDAAEAAMYLGEI